MPDSRPSVDMPVAKPSDAQLSVAPTEYYEFLELCETFQGKTKRDLIRKVDLCILPQLVILYLLAYIDRSNVANAKLFGALTDLRMSDVQWNIALCVFFITYGLSAPPANLLLQKVGPRSWLCLLLVLVGVVQICASLQSTYGGWVAFRLLLGVVESGIFPGCSVVLSMWYAPDEMHSRMSIFYSAASLSGAFSGLLAYAIGGQLDYTWGYRGWRFIYCIEGTWTVVLGVLAFWVILGSPADARRWFNEDERRYLVLRSKFSSGGDSQISENQDFSWAAARRAFANLHSWAIAYMTFSLVTAVYGLSFSLPTIINDLGYSAVQAQVMSAPPYVFACITTVIAGILSDRYKQSMLAILLPSLLSLAGFIIIIISIRYSDLTGLTLFGIFLAAGGLYPITPACTAWVAQNQAGLTKRSVSIAITFVGANAGGIVGSNIYLHRESPEYPTGFGISIAFIVFGGLVVPILYWCWLKRLNSARDSIPEDEIHARYTEQELVEMGDDSPLFKYQT